MRDARRQFLRLAGLAIAGVAGCSGGGERDSQEPTATEESAAGMGVTPSATATAGDARQSVWRTTELTDVVRDETFTIAEQPGPVLLHSFAVWCPKCAEQHKRLTSVHEQVADDVTLVSLNVDPNEDADAVREYAEEGGYDWRFVVSPSAVTESLVDEFGPSITSPPSVPLIVACPDGSGHMLEQSGPKSSSYVLEQLDC